MTRELEQNETPDNNSVESRRRFAGRTSRSTSDKKKDGKAHWSTLSSEETLLLAPAVSEADREVLYRRDLLQLFQQRLRLNAFLGLLLLPLFHFFYHQLAPAVAELMRFPHILLMAVCALFLATGLRIPNITWARALTLFGYALVSLGVSMTMVISSKNQFDTATLTGMQLAMLAAHSQILLSVVLLPLSIWEALALTAIVTLSLAWSSSWALAFESGTVQMSQIFVLLTSAVFVLCVAHSQAILRRRAFDAGFDLARSAAQLQTLSMHDIVTGGFNRFYLERALALEISRAARFSRPLSVAMFDLDNFKIVNDTLGHTTGDEVLRQVGEAAAHAIREVDTVARYGGDEFTLVLPETELDEAMIIAQRVQQCVHQRLQEKFGAQSPESQVTLSMGIITLRPTESLSIEEVFARADERLYEAKRQGKNRIVA